MISSFPYHNLEKILIPIHFCAPTFYTKPSSLLVFFILFTSSLSNIENKKDIKRERTMKVHPIQRKRNITIQYESNGRTPHGGLGGYGVGGGSQKKLRRLPHIFSRVLELPFRSDADVAIEENQDCFRFIAETDDDIGDVRAYMVEIHPGVMKIVIRPNGVLEFSSLDRLELDMWRFRLPETTRPELASAVFVDGELIVTVPKGEGEGEEVEEEVWRDGANGGGFRGGMGNNNNNNNNRLVLVQ